MARLRNAGARSRARQAPPAPTPPILRARPPTHEEPRMPDTTERRDPATGLSLEESVAIVVALLVGIVVALALSL